MALFERADSGRRVTWFSILGLILIPVVIAGGFVFATWQANDRLDSVRAAIVNNDEGAEVDGRQVPLGRQLTAGLVDTEEDNFDWVLSDDEDAASGLAAGDYAVVITIPEGFSRAVMSSAGDDPLQARQATIDVESSQVSPVADATIGQAIANAARNRFNTEFTAQYMDGIYLGFNEMGEQFRDVADAAGQLDEGTSQLAEGTGAAAAGAGELARGIEELDAGSGQLTDGAEGLATGASELADGTRGLSDGAGELADGLGQLADGTAELPDQTRQLADGAGQLSEGVDEYTRGMDELVRQLSSFGEGGSGDDAGGSPDELIDGVDELADGSSALAEGIEGIKTGLGRYQQELADQADGAERLAGAQPDLDGLVEAGLMTSQEAEATRSRICTAPDAGGQLPAEQCEPLERVFAAGLLAGTAGGLGGAAAGLDAEDPNTGESLTSGLTALADGAQVLDEGVSRLRDGLQEGLGGLGELMDGLGQFSDQADELLDGSQQLREGASGMADGTDQLADGMGELSEGIGASADGADQLADGTSRLADGADQLATGAGEFSTGLSQYTDGVGQVATGTGDFALGLEELDSGTQELVEGTSQLADGLEEGADQVPSYTAPERDSLTEAVAQPIAEDEDLLSSISTASTIALLLVMTLWLGALITYTVVRAVSATALTSSKSSWAILARGLLPGILVSLVQAAGLTLLAQIVLDLNFFDLNALLMLGLFAGVVFTVVNFALVAWFGGVGRFISVILVVLAVAGRALSATPEFFSAVQPLLPLTPAFQGATAIVTGVPGLGGAWGGLLGWLILGLGASIIAVARNRVLKPGQVSRLARG
ncbi:YhgE/Pip domain-containing protein [Brevibacterium daeguense]|uniref:YhgE/Pip domain-containing protein n=1 Tax=Brevibacterium daeguense TaxID=909936 RepID=A0ABP8EKR0_9MICO|nr:YhgE/Pip domain-containing protein [Brevibacterium daeguense]